MKSVRCIACDLDGTLVRNDNTISAFTKETLRETMQKDMIVLPCTGRCWSDLCSAFPEELRFPSILLNGALFTDAYGTPQITHAMKEADIEQLEKHLFQYDMPCMYFTADTIYGSGDMSMLRKCSQAFFTDADGDYFMDEVHPIQHHTEIKDPILKMESMHVDTKRLKVLKTSLSDMRGIQVSSSLSFNVEITSYGVNKAAMLKEVLAYYGLSVEECLYFGDSHNDLQVFERFPFTIAVENAVEALKSQAYDICKSCVQDGPAHYIRNKIWIS